MGSLSELGQSAHLCAFSEERINVFHQGRAEKHCGRGTRVQWKEQWCGRQSSAGPVTRLSPVGSWPSPLIFLGSFFLFPANIYAYMIRYGEYNKMRNKVWSQASRSLESSSSTDADVSVIQWSYMLYYVHL